VSIQFNVHQVAHLARLALKPEEEQRLAEEMAAIVAYCEQLRELDVTGISPSAHSVPEENIFRDDVVTESLLPSEALHNAPAQENGYFCVPAVLGQEEE
jgi:aspartyl-tRNA(Asn)/glutamyl-tRNA(Gln) amidotransferase subunit C